MHSLPLFHRIAGAKVVLIGDGEMAAAKRRLVERAGGTCCDEDQANDARLGFVALEDAAEAEAVARRLRARGLLVNVADRPDLCDFTLPSVLERGDVLVAVSTGGASAGLAKQLRLRIETFLPASLAKLAGELKAARHAMRSAWPNAAERRAALDGALAEGGALDCLAAESADKVAAWLGDPAANAGPKAVDIALTSDDPDDLTLRQARLLGTADIIIHHPGISPAILARARADAVRLTPDGTPPPAAGLTVHVRRAQAG